MALARRRLLDTMNGPSKAPSFLFRMAQVFHGESLGLAGFTKSVAIKRVLPHLCGNEKFIRMFLDEARLSARLNHANIVQVFDIGHVDNTYFIVMEFVDGVNLKAIIEYMKKRNT